MRSTNHLENIQHDFVEKTSNDYPAKISLEFRLLYFVCRNPSSRSDSVAVDTFEALADTM